MSSWYDILLVVGRITPSESLFYYDAANGLNYDYYNDTSSYSPAFDIQPTPEQEQEARQVCTVNGAFDTQCAYDLYATGNAATAGVTASTSNQFRTAQDTLGSFVVLLAFCLCQVCLLQTCY